MVSHVVPVEIVSYRDSFARTRRELHTMGLRWSHTLFAVVEVPHKNDRVVGLGDVGATGTYSQATFNINDVLYIEQRQLIGWRVDVTV